MLKSWKFWVVVVVVGIGLGIGAGWVTQRVWTGYHAERLLSADSKTGWAAVGHWGQWLPGAEEKHQRLAESPMLMRAVDRRLKHAPDEALTRFLGKFHFKRYMDSPAMPNMRAVLHDLLERNSSRAMIYRQDSRYSTLAFSYSINGMYDEMEPHLLRMVEHGDADLRESILIGALSLLGAEGEAIIASMLDDPDPTVARRAWLSMAFMDPISGYSGNWRDSPDGVAEGILYAAIATSDRPELLLEEIDANPDLRARFEWTRPFLDRAVEMRRDVPAERKELTAAGVDLIRDEFLFESSEPPPAGTEEIFRRSTVSEAIHQFSRGSKDYEGVIRWVLVHHPLPAPFDMDQRQREFAGDVLSAWWMLNDDDYAFDEDAKVFRRVWQNEKGPE